MIEKGINGCQIPRSALPRKCRPTVSGQTTRARNNVHFGHHIGITPGDFQGKAREIESAALGDNLVRRGRGKSGRGQQPVVTINGEESRINRSNLGFQLPIPALEGIAGGIRGAGHISAGKPCKHLRCFNTFVTAGEVAAIGENVAIIGKCAANGRQLIAVLGPHGGAVDPGRAQAQLSLVTMGQNMYRINAGAAFQVGGNLLHTVSAGIKQHHFATVANCIHQGLIIFQRTVNKHDFSAL